MWILHWLMMSVGKLMLLLPARQFSYNVLWISPCIVCGLWVSSSAIWSGCLFITDDDRSVYVSDCDVECCSEWQLGFVDGVGLVHSFLWRRYTSEKSWLWLACAVAQWSLLCRIRPTDWLLQQGRLSRSHAYLLTYLLTYLVSYWRYLSLTKWVSEWLSQWWSHVTSVWLLAGVLLGYSWLAAAKHVIRKGRPHGGGTGTKANIGERGRFLLYFCGHRSFMVTPCQY